MYEKVLVPFDFSPDSQHAFSCLRYIPGIRQVVLLHVVYTKHPSIPGEYVSPEADYARLRLEELVRKAGETRFSVKVRVEEITGGSISDVVNRVADAEGSSLTLMGRKGQGVIESIFVGSVATDVLRDGQTDILLVGRPQEERAEGKVHPCADLFSHVLICTDFSPPDISALAAERLPRPARVTILHVMDRGAPERETRQLADSARAQLEKCAEVFSRRNVPVGTALRAGNTAEEIAAHAREEGASLIVVKSAGRRGFIPRFLGMTTGNVVRTTRVPILVLKRPGEAVPPRG
ncbi:MAG: universal stress protein [Methanolinea sp.]